jgi:branched-chain amino acid transport system substrate-binding protein
MKTNFLKSLIVLLMTISLALPAGVVHAAQPIVIGCPLATAFLYGWDA